MNEAIAAIIGAAFGGFVSLVIAKYISKSSEGKLKILSVVFHPKGDNGAYIKAAMVNSGRGPIVVNYVLLRDKQGNEDKRHPAIESGHRFGYSAPKKLEPLDPLEVRWDLIDLQFRPEDITEFEALDTLNKAFRYKFPRKLRREIKAWVEEQKLSHAA